MMRHNTSPGFTLVELMLSISFIAILLLSIAMLTIQMSGIYNKGLTLREANQAGQFISSEVQRSLNQTYSQAVEFAESPDNLGGRLCAGTIVYAWNYPEAFDQSNVINRVHNSSDVRFVKFAGVADDYCKLQSDGRWKDLPAMATELLSGTNNADIAIRSFSLSRSSVYQDDTQTIYEVSMVIGTANTGLLTEDGTRCRATDQNEDEWCAVNEFSFTARSGNREVLQ